MSSVELLSEVVIIWKKGMIYTRHIAARKILGRMRE
jgi:hypothetical protein